MLRGAWAFKLAGTAGSGVSGIGALTAGPVVADSVVYLQDEDANVYALTLTTGKLKWEYQANVPEKSGPGPDGVAVAGGTVYGDTSTSAFALSAATGKTIWKENNLLDSGQGAFEIQPQVADGRVYLASAYGSGPGGGALMALSAATGRLLWKCSANNSLDRWGKPRTRNAGAMLESLVRQPALHPRFGAGPGARTPGIFRSRLRSRGAACRACSRRMR